MEGLAEKIDRLPKLDESERIKASEEILALEGDAVETLWQKATAAETPVSRLSLGLLSRLCKKKLPAEKMQEILSNRNRLELYSLFDNDDAKIRRNAAILAGNLADPRDAEPLSYMLENEKTLFIRSSIILALGSIGTESAISALEKAKSNIDNLYEGADMEKHKNEEMLALSKSLAGYERMSFTGFRQSYKFLLKPTKGLENALYEEAIGCGFNPVISAFGIYVETDDYPTLFKMRCFNEALILLCRLGPTPDESAEAILHSKLLQILESSHSGNRFPYRIEIRDISHDQRRFWARSIAASLDSQSKLVNSASSYSFELRLEDEKIWLKLYSLTDSRFSYRQGDIPASINPVTAASIARTCKKYMKPKANVLDPFCGSATMLVEREMLFQTKSLTGIDIYGKAIGVARGNIAAAGLQANLINLDILNYSMENCFDEIISNMPFGMKAGDHETNIPLYSGFVNMLPRLLKPGGYAMLYTMEKKLLSGMISANSDLTLVDRLSTVSGDLDPMLFIIRNDTPQPY